MPKNIVCELNKCAGCMACVDICPTNSISVVDGLEHMNAEINSTTCVNCGRCHQVCQYNHPAKCRHPVYWLQGWGELKVRESSSSGGLAQELMISFIRSGGVVAACIFRNGTFGFEINDSVENIYHFIGLKYVKSNPIGIYKSVLSILKRGQKVLFIGLPCQVSSLLNYIPQKYQDSLYTVDLICHGTPSVKLLQDSLHGYGVELTNIQNIYFRANNKFGVGTEIKKIVPDGVRDRYTMAFLQGLDYTENCYLCSYAQINRVGDLTIGDSWGSNLSEGIDKGISLVLCQTKKGKELLSHIKFHFEKVDLDNAIRKNHQLNSPSIKPPQRRVFFKNVLNGMPFNKVVLLAYPKNCIEQEIKKVLIKIGLISDQVGYNERICYWSYRQVSFSDLDMLMEACYE